MSRKRKIFIWWNILGLKEKKLLLDGFTAEETEFAKKLLSVRADVPNVLNNLSNQEQKMAEEFLQFMENNDYGENNKFLTIVKILGEELTEARIGEIYPIFGQIQIIGDDNEQQCVEYLEKRRIGFQKLADEETEKTAKKEWERTHKEEL